MYGKADPLTGARLKRWPQTYPAETRINDRDSPGLDAIRRDMVVDPNAKGIEFRIRCGESEDPMPMFPVVLVQELKLSDGSVLTFRFENVRI